MKNIKIGLLLTALMGLFGAVGDVCGMNEPEKINIANTITKQINDYLKTLKNNIDKNQYKVAQNTLDTLNNYITTNKKHITLASQYINTTELMTTIQHLNLNIIYNIQPKDLATLLQETYINIMQIKNIYTIQETNFLVQLFFIRLKLFQETSTSKETHTQLIDKMVHNLNIPKITPAEALPLINNMLKNIKKISDISSLTTIEKNYLSSAQTHITTDIIPDLTKKANKAIAESEPGEKSSKEEETATVTLREVKTEIAEKESTKKDRLKKIALESKINSPQSIKAVIKNRLIDDINHVNQLTPELVDTYLAIFKD